MAEWAHCGKCGHWWTGTSRAHCSGCHRTFSGVTLFNRHRVRYKCKDPREVTQCVYNEDKDMWQAPEQLAD